MSPGTQIEKAIISGKERGKMTEQAKKPVMTVPEVHKDLRKCGVRWSEVAIRNMIRAGTFPGVAYYTKNWRYHIPTAQYEAFKKANGFEYIEEKKPDVSEDDKYTQAVREFEAMMRV